MTRLALLLCCCSLDTHAPGLDLCPRVPVASVTAGPGECVRLESTRDALFRLAESESCGGPACLVLREGETALVLERVRPSEGAEWRETRGSCEEMPPC